MPATAIPLRTCLDPRPSHEAAAAAFADSVNIPLAELPARTHELPHRSARVAVVGAEPLAQATLAWLRACGRTGFHAGPGVVTPTAEVVRGRLWSPSAFLEQQAGGLTPGPAPGLAPGLALDLGCGSGRDAVYLAGLGWDVLGVDRLPEALAWAADLARRYAPAGARLDWACHDLRRPDWSPPQPVDLIVMTRYFDPAVVARVRGWLRPNGWLLLDRLERSTSDESGATRLERGESLRNLIGPHEVVAEAVNARGTARLRGVLLRIV